MDQKHSETPTSYYQYLATTYELNRANNIDGWLIHEESLSNSLHRALHDTGKRLSRTSLMLVGPGLHPIREIQGTTQDIVRQLRKVFIADCSQEVADAAMRNLEHEGNIPRRILKTVRMDVTAGRADRYAEIISDALNNVYSLEDLCTALEEIQQHDFTRIFETGHIRSSPDIGPTQPIDVVNYSLVLAGVGAAAEAIAWTRFYSLISESVQRVGDSIFEDEEFIDQCNRIREVLHDIITKFHTSSAILTLRERVMHALSQNHKPPEQISVQDVGTVLFPRKGARSILTSSFLSRIDREKIKQALAENTPNCPPMTLEAEELPLWQDEVNSTSRPYYIPGHGHPIERWRITARE